MVSPVNNRSILLRGCWTKAMALDPYVGLDQVQIYARKVGMELRVGCVGTSIPGKIIKLYYTGGPKVRMPHFFPKKYPRKLECLTTFSG